MPEAVGWLDVNEVVNEVIGAGPDGKLRIATDLEKGAWRDEGDGDEVLETELAVRKQVASQ